MENELSLGATNSEARKRREERLGTFVEPRLLTENHPVYVGEITDEIYRLQNPQESQQEKTTLPTS